MKLLKLVSVLACILISGLAFAAAPGKIAVTSVSGEVVSVADDGSKKAFADGDVIGEKTRVATGADSSAKLVLANGTIVALKPNSEVLISEFVQNNPDAVEGKDPTTFKSEPDETAGSITTIELVKGTATFKVAKLLASSSLTVKTSAGKISVKGTTFSVTDDGTSVTTAVTDGAVSVAPTGRGAVTVSAGRSVSVPAGGGSPSYRAVSAAQSAEIAAAVAAEEAPSAAATTGTGSEIVPAVGVNPEIPAFAEFVPSTGGYSVSDPEIRLEQPVVETTSDDTTVEDTSDVNSPASF